MPEHGLFTNFMTKSSYISSHKLTFQSFWDNKKICATTPAALSERNESETRKRFSQKPIVAFTNSTVFILDLY